MKASEDWRAFADFLHTVPLIVFGLSLVVSGAAFAGATFMVDASQLDAFRVGLLLIPVLSLTAVRQAALQGLGAVVQSRLPEDLLRPLALIVFVFVSWDIAGLPESATIAVAIQLASAVCAFVLGAVLLRRAIPSSVDRVTASFVSAGRLIREAAPLAAASIASTLMANVDILLLGVLVDPAVLGVYVIATRLAMLVHLAEFAVNTAFMPVVARSFAAGQFDRIRRGASRVALGGFAASIALAVPLLVVPDIALKAFGTEFADGDMQLRLLCLTWILSAAAGQNGTILTMTRNNQPVLIAVLLALLANVILILTLVPILEGDGAALARLIAVAIWNGYLIFDVRKRLGFYATAITPSRPIGSDRGSV
jgi:O-antigen/teichoic acid export membrane protein